QSRCVGRLARPENARGLSGWPRNSTISHSSVPSWFRNDSSSAGVANPPLPLEMTLYSQTAIMCREGKTSQKAVPLPRLFLSRAPVGRKRRVEIGTGNAPISTAMTRIDHLLASLGYGTRREARELIAAGRVSARGVP